jgi:hypothetical protein
VKLKLRNGQVVVVPLERFSTEDQLFVSNTKPATTTATASTPAAEKTWPKTISLAEPPEPKTIKEDKDTKEFIYRSEHYEFQCDSKLGANVVKEFSRIFEATWMLNCKLPLDLKPMPEEGQEVFRAKLFTNRQDYLDGGGLQGSGGVYKRSEKMFMVPLSSLGVKMVGSRVSLEKTNDDDNATLVHEITHQMMNHWLRHLRTWFIEGSAVSMEMLEYNHGHFTFTGLKQRMAHYLSRHYSDGKNFTMLDPGELLGLDGKTWADALAVSQKQAAQNYASAGMMVSFFYYFDDAGDGAHVAAFFRALEQSKSKAEDDAALEAHLIRGRTTDQLATEIKKGFRKWGINVDFSSPGKNAVPSSNQ